MHVDDFSLKLPELGHCIPRAEVEEPFHGWSFEIIWIHDLVGIQPGSGLRPNPDGSGLPRTIRYPVGSGFSCGFCASQNRNWMQVPPLFSPSLPHWASFLPCVLLRSLFSFPLFSHFLFLCFILFSFAFSFFFSLPSAKIGESGGVLFYAINKTFPFTNFPLGTNCVYMLEG